MVCWWHICILCFYCIFYCILYCILDFLYLYCIIQTSQQKIFVIERKWWSFFSFRYQCFLWKGKFVTNVYHKKTCSSVYTDFNKLIPKTYKTGLIKSLLFRYFSLYSEFVKFHHEINIFQKVFCITVVPSVTLLTFALINFLTEY